MSNSKPKLHLAADQVWRKNGPDGWLRIIAIMTPDNPDYNNELQGASVILFPPQYSGIQLKGGLHKFLFDNQDNTWQDQITEGRQLLDPGWIRGETPYIYTKPITKTTKE